MRALDKKLLRDVRRLWAQLLAIALVIACGVATLVLATGAYRSLENSRQAYYERNAFADVFATITRAPVEIEAKLSVIPGVSAVETRIVRSALLDVPGLVEPASGLVLSIPDLKDQRLNRLHLREGRLPQIGQADEIVVNEPFASAHAFVVGSRFKAVLNGRQRELRIVGVALSPEFIYAIGPGDLMPDDRRFGVLWMSQKALAGLFDLEGAFNSVTLSLMAGADEDEVMKRVDDILARYGGTGAQQRRDQISHAFIDAELKQLAALARVIPPIFLLVAAFLINITLSRLVVLEREQIGLLKAVGYGSAEIGLHYLKLVLLVALFGILLGFAVGAELGQSLTRLYAKFFRFPVLVFSRDADVYAIAGVVSTVAAALGALRSVRDVLRLSPAVAMQPPAPPRFSRQLPAWADPSPLLSKMSVMALRQMLHRPGRSAFTMLALALAVGILVMALLSFDSVERMIDIAFHQTDRQHATLTFVEGRSPRAIEAVAQLPGVMRVEATRIAPVRLRNGQFSRKLSIVGKPPDMDLSRVLDLDLAPVALPPSGLVLGERVAQLLRLRRGDMVEVDVLEGRRRKAMLPVADVIQSYFGLMVFMRLDVLDAFLGDGPRVTGAHISFDSARQGALYREIKRTPAIASVGLQRHALQKFRETIAQNINYMVSVYVTLAAVIAVGIVYNSARIQLSERARELASLRVLGFTRAEVGRVLLTELAILSVLAIPVGWAAGYAFGWLVIQSFSSDLYRAPFTVSAATYALASLIVLSASLLSALIVYRRVGRLDLVAVLKTRE